MTGPPNSPSGRRFLHLLLALLGGLVLLCLSGCPGVFTATWNLPPGESPPGLSER